MIDRKHLSKILYAASAALVLAACADRPTEPGKTPIGNGAPTEPKARSKAAGGVSLGTSVTFAGEPLGAWPMTFPTKPKRAMAVFVLSHERPPSQPATVGGK